MSLDLIPMLLLSLLLLTAGQEVQTAELVLTGAHDATEHRGALIVGDAQVTVPDGAQVPGPVHVLGGHARILGTVEGDVVHIAGTLTVEDAGAIRGTLQHVGGTLVVAPGAEVARRTSVQVAPDEPGPARRYLPAVLTTGRGGRRRPPPAAPAARDAIITP